MSEIGIGIVGSGNISKIHILALNSMNIIFDNLEFKPKLLGVCSRSGIDKFKIFNKATNDLLELLKDERISAIDICTPNFMHLEQGRDVILSGKSIYMEKPLSMDVNEGKELVDLCNSENVINQVALMYRFTPAVVMAKDFIERGELGEILNFRVSLYHKGYLNSERPISWRLRSEKSGGGALMDLGIHVADLVRFLLGEVSEVRGRTTTYFKQRYIDSNKKEMVEADVDEWAMLDINLQDGGYGTLEVSRISSDLTEDTIFEIYGTKGKIKISTQHMSYPEIYLHNKGYLVKGHLERTSEFAKYHETIYPNSKFDMGWNLNAHMTSLMNFLINIQKGKIIYKETPTFKET